MTPTPLTVTQLFTPAASGVGSTGVVPLSPATGTWLYWELQAAQTVGLPTTAWLPGGIERELLAINAIVISQDDAVISQMAQGSFLQSAALGTVTYQALNGQTITIPVTPDPSNSAQNSTGALGYLDLLGQGVYDVFRLLATYASGPLAIVNTGATTQGPYAAGLYHVASASASYSNLASLTIPSSVIAGGGGIVTSVSVGLTYTLIYCPSPPAAGSIVYVNIPSSSGVSGLGGIFATVASSGGGYFRINNGSSGSYTSGGQVYLCTVATMQADIIGIGSNAAPGAVNQTITQANSVSVSNVVSWSASNYETNQAYATRCQNSLAAASPNGPSAAYVYFAESAYQILSEETPAVTLTNGPVTAYEYATPATGVVTTVVASATPVSTTLGQNVTPGSAQNPVTGATNANPIVISTENPHGLVGSPGSTGTVTIAAILGNTNANGTWTATIVSGSSFSIPIAGNGTWTGGGTVEAGDLGQIDNLLQENVVPDGIIAITVSALAFPIAVAGTVVVPQANVAQYRLAVLPALVAYLASLNIGGDAPDFSVDYDDVIAALGGAGLFELGQTSVVRAYQGVTIAGNGIGPGTANIPFPGTNYQALLASASSITVQGV
jgi:hypothetical protein